jgi:phosphoglycolate phosphatase
VIVLFWDIDGTLLTTARGGVLALEDACLEVTGRAIDLQGLKSDGITDHELAVKILKQVGWSPSSVFIERFLRSYETHLPARLALRRGRVLNGVVENLEYLRASRQDVYSKLLTGNTKAGANAKLAHYGLQRFFETGEFSVDTSPREAIAVRALRAVQAQFAAAHLEPSALFVIGDTPHDIACAEAIGARSIAVATGNYSAEALEARGPSIVLDELPDPPTFVALLDSFARRT